MWAQVLMLPPPHNVRAKLALVLIVCLGLTFNAKSQNPVIAPLSGSVVIVNCVDIEVTTQGLTQNQINQIEWYFDDGVNPSNMVHVGTTDYQPQQPGNYYVVFPFYPPGFQQSNNVSAENYSPISVAQAGGTLLRNQYSGLNCHQPITLTGQLNPNYSYGQKLWKRNGNGLIGEELGLPDIDRPGLYTFEVDGPCGVDFDTITVFYDCDLASACYSTTYLTGGTVTTSISLADEIIGGELILDGINTLVLFTHEFNMLPGSQIIVRNGATIRIDRAIFRSCGVWKGILVEGTGNIEFSGVFGDNKIFDAEVAIAKLGSGSLSGQFFVSNFIFEDNGVHIVCDNTHVSMDFCLFKNISVGRNISTQSISNILSNKSTDYPMVFLSNNEMSNFISNTFDMRRPIDVIGSNSPPFLSQFDPNVITAMELLNSIAHTTGIATHVDGINIYDGFLNGIFAKNSYGLQFLNLNFGSDFLIPIANYPLASRHGHYRSNNGLIFKQCKNILSGNSEIRPESYGLQFYYNDQIQDPSNFGSISTSLLKRNQYIGGTAGIVVAPDVNPLTNTDQNLNANATPIDLDILCSDFIYNTYGIIGGGRKTDFEGIIPNTPHNITQLDPGLNFSNPAQWNIIWSELISGNPSNIMKYYSDPMTTPLQSSGTAVILDGVSVVKNYGTNPAGVFDNPANTSATGSICTPPSGAHFVLSEEKMEQKLNILLFPNPFDDLLTIELADGYIGAIKITNMMGQVMKDFYIESISQSYTFQTNDFSKGVYFLTIENNNVSQTFKLIKH